MHLIVFLEKGPLYLVAVSSADEPESALRLQLDLLHAHFLAILTDNFDKMLARNPRFEPRRLLGTSPPHTPRGEIICGDLAALYSGSVPMRWLLVVDMAPGGSSCRYPQYARRSHLP